MGSDVAYVASVFVGLWVSLISTYDLQVKTLLYGLSLLHSSVFAPSSSSSLAITCDCVSHQLARSREIGLRR
ncbi:hypothetical protein BDV98DRAFT_274972 [Pterulicium gracile]|uniref:Uncharacterized protein n=1 Tax=Pterulicium gracile TaxID=1884261 RepID=A0A5C3Q7D1_9AGAR|nr:hypothetical protein BDV98DRAFT_274972 [Pterula gracilis]